MFENKKILILGAAKSGISVAKLLANKNNDITLSDLKPLDNEVQKELEDLKINIIVGDNQIDLIDNSYDFIIKNPAILYTSPIVKKVEELNIPLVNEMEVAYHFLPKDITIVGVTGSNGKTTTTTLIYELLKRHNKSVVLGGNIGYPLAQVIDKVKEKDILLLEISDHQLCDIHDFKTNISVLTNICPTHLDYHGTYEHYMWTKAKIFNKHTKDDVAIINKANDDAMQVSNDILSTKKYFNDELNYFDEKSIYIEKEIIIDTEDIMLKGNHNYENILAALLVVKELCPLDKKVIKDFLASFGGVEHRLEFVREKDGVKYYNDSKATNPTATITALKTFNEPIHLILGGMERNQDFNELNDYMKCVKKIYAIGTVTDRVVDYAKSIGIDCIACQTLAKAVEELTKYVEKGDIVLLSTASASQDVYVKFEDRGDEFKNLVANL